MIEVFVVILYHLLIVTLYLFILLYLNTVSYLCFS